MWTLMHMCNLSSQCINSSPPSSAYMRQWIRSTSVQIVAYPNQCWVTVNWAIRDKLQWNFNQNKKNFIHENASANIGSHFVQGELKTDKITTKKHNKNVCICMRCILSFLCMPMYTILQRKLHWNVAVGWFVKYQSYKYDLRAFKMPQGF